MAIPPSTVVTHSSFGVRLASMDFGYAESPPLRRFRFQESSTSAVAQTNARANNYIHKSQSFIGPLTQGGDSRRGLSAQKQEFCRSR
jgi:hypothetical protein